MDRIVISRFLPCWSTTRWIGWHSSFFFHPYNTYISHTVIDCYTAQTSRSEEITKNPTILRHWPEGAWRKSLGMKEIKAVDQCFNQKLHCWCDKALKYKIIDHRLHQSEAYMCQALNEYVTWDGIRWYVHS